MTVEEFDSTMLKFSEREPFEVFTVELQNGRRIEIDRPFGFALRNGHAVTMTRKKEPIWFDHNTVARIVEGRMESIAN